MNSFNDLPLSEHLFQAISDLGYQKPSPIQAQALPLLLGKETDFIGLAATGTGKTAAFSIPLLEKMDAKLRTVQAIILCPTRELALQVSEQIQKLGEYKGVKTLAVYGGSSYRTQIDGLKSGAQIIIGTPGRMVDLLERKILKLNQVRHIILDEADEMISMGFKEDLETILGATDRSLNNIWLFSATMSKEIRRVSEKYLKNPVQVQVNRTEILPSSIHQSYFVTKESNKPEVLCKMMDAAEEFYGIIFCQTKSMVQDLAQYLTEKGYKVDCLHGDKDQKSRERTMQSFRDRKVKVLVCTDVASRGLDIKDITHVINFSLPNELDSYVHRIGRTARSGKEGFAMSLVTPSQEKMIFRLERITRSKMHKGVIPSRKQVGIKKISRILPMFIKDPPSTRAMELLDEDWQKTLSGMSPTEVAARFLAMMNPTIFTEDTEIEYSFKRSAPPQHRKRQKSPSSSWSSRRRSQRSSSYR